MQIIKPAYVNSHHRRKDSIICGIYSIDFHPNGMKYATGGGNDKNGSISIWSMDPLRNVDKENDEKCPKLLFSDSSHIRCVNSVRWSQNGKYLASGSSDSLVLIWVQRKTFELDKQTKNHHETYRTAYTLRGHQEDVLEVAWSSNGKYLCSGGIDNKIIIWNGEKLPEKISILSGHTSFVKGLAWDPVGRYLASQSEDETIRIWRTSDWKQESIIRENLKTVINSGAIARLSWSPDGQTLIAPGTSNNAAPTCQFYNRDTWVANFDLIGHRRHLLFAKFFPTFIRNTKDSKEYALVVIGGRDRSLSFWVTFKNRPLGVLSDIFVDAIYDASWNSEEMELLVSSLDGNIAYIKLDPKVFGTPFTRNENRVYIEKLYGRDCLTEFQNSEILLNGSNGLSNGGDSFIIPESAAVLELEKQRREMMGNNQADSSVVTATSLIKRPTGPKEQIIQRTQSGKRRITPKFVSHLDEYDINPEEPVSKKPCTSEKENDENTNKPSLLSTNIDIKERTSPQISNENVDENQSEIVAENESKTGTIKLETKVSMINSENDTNILSNDKSLPDITSIIKNINSESTTQSVTSVVSIPITTTTTTTTTTTIQSNNTQINAEKIDKIKTLASRIEISNNASNNNNNTSSNVSSIAKVKDEQSGVSNTSDTTKSTSSLKSKCVTILTQQPTIAPNTNTVKKGNKMNLIGEQLKNTNNIDNNNNNTNNNNNEFVDKGLCMLPDLNKEFCLQMTCTTSPKQTNQGTLLCIYQKENHLKMWDCFITKKICAILGSGNLIFAGDEGGRLHIFSCQSGRLESPFIIGAGSIATITLCVSGSHDKAEHLVVVSKESCIHVWQIYRDVWITPRFIMTNDIAHLIDSPNNNSVSVKQVKLKFDKNGNYKLFLLFTTGSHFMYLSNIGVWQSIVDESNENELWAVHELYKTVRKQNPSNKTLSNLQKSVKTNKTPPISSIQSSSNRMSLLIDEAYNQMKRSEVLESPAEYRYWLQKYTRSLIETNDQNRVKSLLESLIGPVNLSSKTSWSPTILGLNKRELVEGLLPLFGMNLRLQSLYTELKELLEIIKENQHI